MMDERLLYKCEYHYQEEVANIEYLKKRFGDQALQACEIMMNDIADARRVNQDINVPIRFG